MTLYHVSTRLEPPMPKDFVPKVPESAMSIEDRTTPRICFAPTVKQCLEAIGLNTEEQEYITVYQLDTGKVDPSHVLDPLQVYEKHNVIDALDTCEHWVTCPLRLFPMYARINKAQWKDADGYGMKKLTSLKLELTTWDEIQGKNLPKSFLEHFGLKEETCGKCPE